MFFRVESLGPLREAEVDLSKPMILLTGPNSTGKTYVAWSIYGLFRNPAAPELFRALADEILAAPKQEIGFDRLVALWPRLLEAIAKQFAGRLHLCFAAERQHFADVQVTLRPGPNEPLVADAVPAGLHFGAGAFDVHVRVGEAISIRAFRLPRTAKRTRVEPVPFADIPSESRSAIDAAMGDQLGSAVMSKCWPDCTLLPTERTAVDMFARELSLRRTEMVNKAVEAELDPSVELASITRDVGRYPWPIQDSLRMANDLAFIARSESAFADLASELEGLLGGGVSVTTEGAIGFTPTGGAQTIGIHLASSVVKSLVSLVFFFRHLAQKGDLLMIDEPELNLHPDNQRKVARVLAKAVNRGLRIIMSTHSDYVLRELNNLILLARDTKPVHEIRERHGYAESELLTPDKVGVYLFREGTAEAVPVTEDGFEVRTIEDEINRMNAVSQDIYAALHE